VRMPRRTSVLQRSVAPVKSSAIAPSNTLMRTLPGRFSLGRHRR
jgi:hypothetical protein